MPYYIQSKILETFLQVLNMSLTASIIIVFVLVVRLLLKRAPKIFSYAMWSVVFFRLLCQVSFESMFSLLPINASPISIKIIYSETPQISTDITTFDNAITPILPAPANGASVNPLQIAATIGEILWLFGMVVLLTYCILSLFRLRKNLIGAVKIRDNIFLADHIALPFVIGVLRPKIYLPSTLSEQEQSYIILHEQTHIRRLDHIVKIVAFLALTVHWFNPLVWLAFFLCTKDMEMSCDEAVMKKMNEDIRADYSASLLSLATGRKIVAGVPLAFGEGDTKGRIKNVMKYKKPAFWMTVVAAVVCIAVSVCLIANPRTDLSEQQPQPEYENQDGNSLEPTAVNWSPEQSVDIVGIPELHFASEDIVIFHGYFGLFVYDLDAQKIIRSLDLKPLNCAAIQGDDYCEVSVSTDGNMVQLHRLSSENMYVYTVSDNTLWETAYERMDDRFGSSFTPIEDVVDTDYLGNYSYNAVKFGEGEYGYLNISEWTLGTLTYVRGDMVYQLFDVSKQQAAVVTESANITYTQKEIDEAIKTAEIYFQEVATNRTLERIWFDEEACAKVRSSYMQYGNGHINGVKEGNVIVLLCDFEINDDPSFEGRYPGWNLIFIRENEESAWILDDQGV